MSLLDARSVPVDDTSAARLRDSGLDYRAVDAEDTEAVRTFFRADARGFLDPEPTDDAVARMVPTFASRRCVGVYEGADRADLPVATVSSWVTPLTVPGGEVPMWAISSVTVAATHRRRGIARALLEGELRAASAAGMAIAGLTVSEATIYGRYGFGPAVPVTELRIGTRRAGWRAPGVPGRLEYVERADLAAVLSDLHESTRSDRAGQIAGWTSRWEHAAGLSSADKLGDAVRGVRFLDADGVTRGVLAYHLAEEEGTFRFSLHVRQLIAQTPEARRALWGFALQHDLVDEVRADLRPVDDPLPWLVADQRGVQQRVHDHGWLRILDVPAALSSRQLSGPVEVTLAVSDPLGIASGTWRLRVTEEGQSEVVPADEGEADITLGIAELSSAYLGGESLIRLAEAGLVRGEDAAIVALHTALSTLRPPHLSIWY